MDSWDDVEDPKLESKVGGGWADGWATAGPFPPRVLSFLACSESSDGATVSEKARAEMREMPAAAGFGVVGDLVGEKIK